MYTIHRTIGVAGQSEVIVPVQRAVLGGYEPGGDQYADSPAIACEVWPGGGLPITTTLPAAWLESPVGHVVVDTPEEEMSLLTVGRWRARVRTTADNQEVAAFLLVMVPGVGGGVLRPAYHTYEDLLREYPAVERFASKLHDVTGFAITSAEARDWVDDRIIERGRRHPGRYGCAASYADAIAADGLIVDSPGGRQIVKASIYKALSMILRRAEGVTNKPEDLVDRQQYYEALAERTLDESTACFADEYGLCPVRMGGPTFGRVTR